MNHHVLFLGETGLPYRRNAAVNRLRQFLQLILHDGNHITCINRRPLAQKHELPDFSMENLDIIECSGSSLRPSSFLIRNFQKVILPFLEFFHILRLHRIDPIHVIHVYSQDFLPVLQYVVLSKILGIRIILHYVELRSRFTKKKTWFRQWNDRLLDGGILKWFDGYIVISDVLEAHVRKYSSDKPILKVPPICDFTWFAAQPKCIRPKPFLLYCGSASYMEVIEFIFASWRRTSLAERAELVLVVNGSKAEINRVQQISNTLSGVVIMHDLQYPELIGLYKAASGLLVPLRDTEQDRARFPQKCCEYLASEGLLLTTAVGEMDRYFKDGVSALVAPVYDPQAFSMRMQYAIDNPREADVIRAKGYLEAKSIFDRGQYGTPLFTLLALRDKFS